MDTRLDGHDEDFKQLHSAINIMSKEMTDLKIAINRVSVIVVCIAGFVGTRQVISLLF